MGEWSTAQEYHICSDIMQAGINLGPEVLQRLGLRVFKQPSDRLAILMGTSLDMNFVQSAERCTRLFKPCSMRFSLLETFDMVP